jgi:O-methyltransferase
MTEPPRSAMGQDTIADTVALAKTAPPGCFVEVGVYRGGMAWHLAAVARERRVRLHLFDTFAGMPFADPEDCNGVGSFADTSIAEVGRAIPDAVFHVGIFPDTLPADLRDIAFVHCDCDQYRSVRAVIDHLWSRLVPGGLMVFDDWDTPGGKRAIQETFKDVLSDAGNRRHVRKPA